MKIAVIGCGLRTPLLIYGLAHSDLNDCQLVLYDIKPDRASTMAALGRAIATGTPLKISAAAALPDAIEDCSFVISSFRTGDMQARARDERLAFECGFAGQETTGPAGFAMALRTVPIALAHARLVEQLAPEAWIISFTNPAGLVTQAVSTQTSARIVGICDTPAELFFRISLGLNRSVKEVECNYFGLNHLGWVRGVRLDGHDVMDRILNDSGLLRSLYSAELFPPTLLRELRLLPTEYLFFYYRQQAARANQASSGATRAEELVNLNEQVIAGIESQLERCDPEGALQAYRAYLNRRNASYMHLEASGKSAFDQPDFDWNPFEGETGYHRIALETISALCKSEPSRIVLNVPNQGAIDDLAREDVIEVPCWADRSGVKPLRIGQLPDAVRGLTISVKTYERLTIEAAVQGQRSRAILALFMNPIVGDWDAAQNFVDRLIASDPAHFDYLS